MKLRQLLLIVSACIPGTSAHAADAPQLQSHDNFQNVVRLPDGTLWRLASRFNAVYYSPSFDNGLTWQGGFTTAYKLFDTGGGLNPIPTVGLDGALHLFQVRSDGAGGLDLYHIQSDVTRTTWGAAEFIRNGIIGSMVKAITLSNGRLIAPFGDSSVTPPTGYGNNKTYVQYRDVGSTSFTTSPSALISPVPSDWNGAKDGACEPTVIQKNNGSLWMLMRSQTGKLAQSTSADNGATWSAAVDSNFYTTSGPPCLVRMVNGDMVMLWNNATMPPKYNNTVWYGGRDVLHAAISKDDGVTWQGFREIYLDPYRNENPVSGDTGTAYPFATATNDGRIIAITGQASAKAQLRIDPAWLLEKNRSDDFTAPGALNNWSVFKPYGDVISVKRSRVQGAVLIDDPDPARTKPVLNIRRPDSNDPDGATWNFPMAARGTTSVRVQLRPGFAGGEIALTDRFFNPTDTQGEVNSFYRLAIPASGLMPGGLQMNTGQWYDLSIDWKTAARKAVLKIDGQKVATFDAQSGINVWPGLSYLRLRSTAPGVDTAGFIVDSVSQNAIARRDAQRMTTTEAETALVGGSGWTTIRFDDFVPNLNPGTSGNGATGAFASPYGAFINSTGVQVESSTGTVSFGDATSSQVTSDIIAPTTGQTLTLRMVFPKDPAFAATASGLALRTGSMAADNVNVIARDSDGVELPDWNFAALSAGTTGTVGWLGLEDLQTKSLIHTVQFSSATTDAWMIGSFAALPTLNDMAVKDLKVAGSHWTRAIEGNWHSAANWDTAIPDSPTAVACFIGSFSGALSVVVDAPVSVNRILFDSVTPHIVGGSTLTFAGAGSRIAVTQGSHQITAPVVVGGDIDVNILAGSTLTFGGQVAAASSAMSKLGDGALVASTFSVESLNVAKGLVQLSPNGAAAGVAQLRSLNVDSTAKLDLTNNSVVIDYDVTDPSATIRASIITGRNGGAWNGTGIQSSIAAGGAALGVGYANVSDLGISNYLSSIPVDSTTLIIRTTLLGDATLDGKVDTRDFNQLSGHFGTSAGEWAAGDFDYDNQVNSIDLNALISNYGKTLSPSLGAIVPEPSLFSGLLIFSLSLWRRHA